MYNDPSPKPAHPQPRPTAKLIRRSRYALAIAALLQANAFAAPPPMSFPANTDDTSASSGTTGFWDGLNRSNALLGDMGGLRSALSNHGISLGIQETSEYLGNTSGGTRQGFEYEGLTTATMQLNTQRAFGLYGGLFNVSALQIHGNNLSASNLDTLQTASGIEADRGTRLWELWYDQKFLDEDRLDIKVGQQSLDQEFMVSTNALYFVNTMFGWPMLPSADMPAGGPAYPLSALGTRFAIRPVNGVTVLAGVFSATPVSNSSGDSQIQNHNGLSFPVGHGTLSIVEVQFSYPTLGSMVEPGQSEPLGWTYRIGAWYNTQQFSDQRYDDSGLSLANPLSSGNAQQHHGDYAVYAVADHLVWRDATDPNRTIALFARVMGTPLKDRNLIDFSLNAGMVFHSPFRYRTDDTFGIGVGEAHVSSQASAYDADNNAYNGTTSPVRSSEKFVELTYQYQVTPWLQVQPDNQYVFNPGAGVVDPNDASRRLKNELVLGVRTNISF